MSMDAKDENSLNSPNANLLIKQTQDPKAKSPIPPWAPDSSPFPPLSLLPVRSSQHSAVDAIIQFMKDHPDQQIPSNLITEPLVETQGERGHCLIGGCGIARRRQKLDPAYDPNEKTGVWLRLNHLWDHVRDRHFHNKPFICDQWCAPSLPQLFL